MGMFDKVKDMKDKASGLADQASDMAGKVPGGEAIAGKIDDAKGKMDEMTDKIPGVGGEGDAEAEVESE